MTMLFVIFSIVLMCIIIAVIYFIWAYNEKFISYMDKNNNFFYWNNNNPLYYRYADAIFNDYYFSKFY